MTVARTAKEVKDGILVDSLHPDAENRIDQRKIGAMIGRLNEAFGGAEARYLACAWLLDKLGKESPDNPDVLITGLSSKSIPLRDWYGIWCWIGFYQEDGEWKTSPEFPLEAMLVLTEAMKEYGKLPKGKQEDRSFVDTIVMQAVSELKGVITNVKKLDGEWHDTRRLELPSEYKDLPPVPEQPRPSFKRPTYDIDI